MQNDYKLIFLGNSQTVELIGTYPEKNTKSYLSDALKIFERYCRSESKSPNQRSKVTGREGIHYFTIGDNEIFYLVLADKSVREREVFGLIDQLENDNIHLMVSNETKKLNNEGKKQLENTIRTYIENVKENNKMEQINIELKETNKIMKDNIKDLTVNIEHVEVLEGKSNAIKEGANAFKNSAYKVERETCKQRIKWWIILILVIVILLIIILPVSLIPKKKNKNKNK